MHRSAWKRSSRKVAWFHPMPTSSLLVAVPGRSERGSAGERSFAAHSIVSLIIVMTRTATAQIAARLTMNATT